MSLSNFVRKVEGWIVSADGEDYCSLCWPIYLERYPPKMRGVAKQNARPLANRKLANVRCKCSDGWIVRCRVCRATVSEPKNPEPEERGTT